MCQRYKRNGKQKEVVSILDKRLHTSFRMILVSVGGTKGQQNFHRMWGEGGRERNEGREGWRVGDPIYAMVWILNVPCWVTSQGLISRVKLFWQIETFRKGDKSGWNKSQRWTLESSNVPSKSPAPWFLINHHVTISHCSLLLLPQRGAEERPILLCLLLCKGLQLSENMDSSYVSFLHVTGICHCDSK